MNGKIRVKCIKSNNYGFIVGNIYDAYKIKSSLKNKDNTISVVNSYGEEYAYPDDLFEIIGEAK